MPSLSKSFKFTVYNGIGNTATSVAVAYPLYPIGTTGTQVFTSIPEQGAGYYGTTSGLHTLAVNTTPTFVGTATIQATLAVDPGETDWFNVNDAEFVYTTSSPGYIEPIRVGAIEGAVRTEHVIFTGQFAWLRTKIQIDSGAIITVSYNY
jgi:hypothetical protein